MPEPTPEPTPPSVPPAPTPPAPTDPPPRDWWDRFIDRVEEALGRPVVRRLVGQDALERQERWARSGGRSLAAVLLIQLSIPSDLAGYVFGLIRTPLGPFVTALALAEIPYGVGAVFLGLSFVERRLVPLVIVGVAGAALSVAAFRPYRRRVDPAGDGGRVASS